VRGIGLVLCALQAVRFCWSVVYHFTCARTAIQTPKSILRDFFIERQHSISAEPWKSIIRLRAKSMTIQSYLTPLAFRLPCNCCFEGSVPGDAISTQN
jgi:hypothetical protein